MIAGHEARTISKQTRAQWERLIRTPGMPETFFDGRNAQYRPVDLAAHMRRYNELQMAQTIPQLRHTLRVSRATLNKWQTHPEWPAPLGTRHGLPVYCVAEVEAFQLKLTGGYKWKHVNTRAPRAPRVSPPPKPKPKPREPEDEDEPETNDA